MAREKKAQVMDSLEAIFTRCSVGILTDYRGLATAELNSLRRKLREAGIDYKVVKNTLARLAAKRVGWDKMAGSFEGPVAVAFGYGEISEPAKVLMGYIKGSKSTLGIKGGFLGDRLLTPAEVETLSALPAREVLLGQVMAGIQGPIVALASVLAAPIRGMMGVLQARMKQLEGR
jgi:large subunit ribosomal protein L10